MRVRALLGAVIVAAVAVAVTKPTPDVTIPCNCLALYPAWFCQVFWVC